MDYSKIRLKNERNSHVVKRLNRLGAWGFFKVLYRDNVMRLFGFSLLMLLCIAPILAVQFVSQVQIGQLKQTLPYLNSFGFSSGVWVGVDQYYASRVATHNLIFGLYTVAAAVAAFIVFSGGFAVIRDGYWTGKLSTVGVFKSMGKGIAANAPYAIVSTVLIAFGVFGVVQFYQWLALVTLNWVAILITVIVSILLSIVACYLMILCSVSVTYKQTLSENLDDSWRLLWLNFLPNYLHLLIALLPLPLYFVFGNGFLRSLFLVLILMFGGIYFPLVWQTHMMKTFALFHPVEAKKKKDVKREEQEMALAQAREAAAKKEAKKQKKSSDKMIKTHIEEPTTEQTSDTTDAPKE